MDGDKDKGNSGKVLGGFGDEENLMFATTKPNINYRNYINNIIDTTIENASAIIDHYNLLNSLYTKCPTCSKMFLINTKQKSHIYCSAKCRIKSWCDKHPRVSLDDLKR